MKLLLHLILSVSWLWGSPSGHSSVEGFSSISWVFTTPCASASAELPEMRLKSHRQLLLQRPPVEVTFQESRMTENPSLNVRRSMLTSSRLFFRRKRAAGDGDCRVDDALTAFFFFIIALAN